MRASTIKVAVAAIGVAAILSAVPIAAHAQQMARAEPNDISSASSRFSATSVFVGGTPIMRVRFGADGFTPQQRAESIQLRVNKLLGEGPIHPEDITVRDIDSRDSAVYVKDQLLFTADRETARYDQTSAHALAEQWAQAMRNVLPSLTYNTG